ncbi:MAG: hypothetical protein FWG27_00710 [Treponema sp.]|jgi:hypothetical protein|nr:hypothetical protein [Treponema sp.]
MSVYIFTKKEAALKTAFSKNAEFSGMAALSKHTQKNGDISYLDVSGIAAADQKKILTQLKKRCKDTPWGIIDPRGDINDPAALFFEGASDYLGPGFFKNKSIDLKRIKAAAAWRPTDDGTIKGDPKDSKGTGAAGLPKTGIKIPAGSPFPGWKNMQPGKTMPFYLLYCSLQGKMALNSRLGEKIYTQMHQRLLAYLHQHFQEGEGLLWMDTARDCLFLLPPKIKNAEAAVIACMRMLVSVPLLAVETLDLTIPANYVFALHFGSVSYSPPGRTGTVVSDAVNFVFHLGTKKAEPGRLTISGDLPDGTIPKALEDSFISAGEFEDRKIWHTKKFSYIGHWL